jgi:hypothetical protein
MRTSVLRSLLATASPLQPCKESQHLDVSQGKWNVSQEGFDGMSSISKRKTGPQLVKGRMQPSMKRKLCTIDVSSQPSLVIATTMIAHF